MNSVDHAFTNEIIANSTSFAGRVLNEPRFAVPTILIQAVICFAHQKIALKIIIIGLNRITQSARQLRLGGRWLGRSQIMVVKIRFLTIKTRPPRRRGDVLKLLTSWFPVLSTFNQL